MNGEGLTSRERETEKRGGDKEKRETEERGSEPEEGVRREGRHGPYPREAEGEEGEREQGRTYNRAGSGAEREGATKTASKQNEAARQWHKHAVPGREKGMHKQSKRAEEVEEKEHVGLFARYTEQRREKIITRRD